MAEDLELDSDSEEASDLVAPEGKHRAQFYLRQYPASVEGLPRWSVSSQAIPAEQQP